MPKQEIRTGRVERLPEIPKVSIVDGAPYIQAAKEAIQLEVGFVRDLSLLEQVRAAARLIKKDRDTFVFLSPYQVLEAIAGGRIDEISEHDKEIYTKHLQVAMDGWLSTILSGLLLQFRQF